MTADCEPRGAAWIRTRHQRWSRPSSLGLRTTSNVACVSTRSEFLNSTRGGDAWLHTSESRTCTVPRPHHVQVTIVMGDHGPTSGPHRSLQPFPFLSVTLSDDLAKAPGWKQYRETLKCVLCAHTDKRDNGSQPRRSTPAYRRHSTHVPAQTCSRPRPSAVSVAFAN